MDVRRTLPKRFRSEQGSGSRRRSTGGIWQYRNQPQPADPHNLCPGASWISREDATICRLVAAKTPFVGGDAFPEPLASCPLFHPIHAVQLPGQAPSEERFRGSKIRKTDLVVGADGRHSTVREKAGLRAGELGAPMDVLWFSIVPAIG